MPTYSIPEENIEALEKKLAVIQRKCAKYGCDFMYRRVGEHMIKRKEEVEWSWSPVTYWAKMIDIEVEGKAVAENGWEIVGAVEKLEGGNFITPFIDRQIPERYRNAEMICEHCQSKRARKSVVLMYNEEKDEWKQVGKSCMLDFTGKFNAEDAAFIAQFFDSIRSYADEYCKSYALDPYRAWWDTKTVLCYAVECIKHWGYQKEGWGDNDRTNMRIARCLFQHPQDTNIQSLMASVKFDAMSTANVALVEDICSRLLALDAEDEYTENLQILLKSEQIQFSKFQFVASAVPYYNRLVAREEEQKREAAMSPSNFIGEVGDKIVFDIDSISLVGMYTSSYGYSSQTTYRYKFVTPEGNIVMWDASNPIWEHWDAEKIDGVATVVGLPLQIKATVKKLDEFRGVKQTWITRGKVTQRTERILNRYVNQILDMKVVTPRDLKVADPDSTNGAEEGLQVFFEACEALDA